MSDTATAPDSLVAARAPLLTWRVGDVKITRIVELDAVGGSRFILPQATKEIIREIEWLQPHFADAEGRLKMSIHALVVETPTRRIVVDTCIGNDKPRASMPAWDRMQTNFLADLEAAGFPPESIDTVLCTHLHVDHVGWNTMLEDGRWVPTFPRARYLFGETELAHWNAEGVARLVVTDAGVDHQPQPRRLDQQGVDRQQHFVLVVDEVRIEPGVLAQRLGRRPVEERIGRIVAHRDFDLDDARHLHRAHLPRQHRFLACSHC